MRGQLTELRVSDLRFTNSEAAGFLNQVMGLNLSAENIAALEMRTEGWIAGLQLAALSMRGHEDTAGFIQSFTGSHHFVLDYLLEEVLHQQSEIVQSFLLRTSILDRLCGPLCDAVRFGESPSSSEGSAMRIDETADGRQMLQYLQQTNLFIIPLDDERRWYRYHHLFADLLRDRLQRTEATAAALLLYAFGLVGYSGVKVLAPAFYALHRPRVPLVASLVAVAGNLSVAIWLFPRMGFQALALGTALASLVNASILAGVFQLRVGGLLGQGLLRPLRGMVAGAALAWIMRKALKVAMLS